MITKFPSLANTGMGELFRKLYPIFGTNDPAKDYLIIFKPDEIIFTSHMNTFKVTNFKFFTEMISYFNIIQRDVSSITDEGAAIREKNLKSIYSDFFLGEAKGNIFFKDDLSKYICRNLSKKNEVWLSIDNQKMDKLEIKNTKVIGYDDALLVSYLKGKLFGFPYNNYIKQVVIDEAQDYNYLQYVIIKEMFKKADFTILGDVNQNINPYYKYDSLEELKEIFNDSNYLELLKTYRSTKEIIEYTNKILNLDYVNAIKKSNNKDVLIRKPKDIKESLLDDIKTLTNTYKSLAIITKEDREAEVIYDLLKDDLSISLLSEDSKSFIKDLVVVPSYIAKGLEFDSVIIVDSDESFKKNKYLYYVACTRAREELIIYE